MDVQKMILEGILALIGGCLGASISALGGFVLLGLAGLGGFIYMLFTGDASWLSLAATGALLKPSSCFLGGVVATAWARRKNLIFCGKDIGRSLMSFKRFDFLLVGALAGLAGYLLNTGLDHLIGGKVDTTALSIVIISLSMKYLWRLTRTNDCTASSHAVPSPYRFFEKLSNTAGKNILSIAAAVITVLVVWSLSLSSTAAPFAGAVMFFISALSLYFVFMGIPVPPTHHYTGPVGVISVLWLSASGSPATVSSWIVLLLWGIAISQLGLIFCGLMGKLFFDEGDIHVDPPAMGIMLATTVCLTLIPLTGILKSAGYYQIISCIVLLLISVGAQFLLERKRLPKTA